MACFFQVSNGLVFVFVVCRQGGRGKRESGFHGPTMTACAGPQSFAIFTSASHPWLNYEYVSSTELDIYVLVSSKNAFPKKKIVNEFTQLFWGALLIDVSWAAFLSPFPLKTWSLLFWGGNFVTFKRMWVAISHFRIVTHQGLNKIGLHISEH